MSAAWPRALDLSFESGSMGVNLVLCAPGLSSSKTHALESLVVQADVQILSTGVLTARELKAQA